jgi:hypothetical protein
VTYIFGGRNLFGMTDYYNAHSSMTLDAYGGDIRISGNTGKVNFYYGPSNTWNNIECNILYQHSDARSKTNITSLNNGLKVIKQLRGVSFNWKDEKAYYNGKKEYGFIAQEVEQVIKEAVITDDTTGFKALSYSSIEPFLVEAIKELSFKVDSLEKIINSAKSSGSLKSSKISTASTETTDGAKQPSLDQNAPNPFSQATQIGYFLPETINSATLNIYNMSGAPVKTIQIFQKGKGSITINGAELNPGMYLYTLIADGKEVDTKRMILTE